MISPARNSHSYRKGFLLECRLKLKVSARKTKTLRLLQVVAANYYPSQPCCCRFLLKYADIELQAALDGAVPPIKVESISVLRPVLFKFQREAQLVFFWVALRVYKFARQTRSERRSLWSFQLSSFFGGVEPAGCCLQSLRLQEQIAAVDLKKLETNIAKDLESMTKWAKSCADESNRNAHLDLKYLNARYEKGVRLVDEFMQKRHEYKDSTIGLATAQPDNEAGPQGTLRRTVVLPRIESRS